MFGNSFQVDKSGAQSLGVDFGSRSTKVLLLNQIGDRIDIQAAGSFTNPGSGVKNGIISEPREFGRRLANYLAENSVSCETAVFDIPSNLAVLRWVVLPDLEGGELKEAAKYKVRKHLPFPLDSAYIEVAQRNGMDKDAPCLIVAVPKKVIDSRAEAILNAGIVPIRAELEAQAILRIVERKLNRKSALWRDASLTIIDFGATNTHMYVVQNQQLQFIRGVKFGSAMFHDAVSKGLNVSAEEAEIMLHDPFTVLNEDGILTLPYENSIALVNLSAELEKLTREVWRLMRYFRSLHPERSYAGILDQAILVGGLVGLDGFAHYLERKLGLRIEFARPIAGMMTRFNQDTFANVSNRQEAYSVVMGLALAGLSQNVLKRSQAEGGREYNWIRSA
ncbi:MAG: type IV pilus assembly protein PilM [Armatimonadetes bacterium]|nr:type IV pilus assembly protein PilM [Armatimonadota bacterium]MBS1700902.1 type IV pilus assembly protein PilM [Armatimonadota bacterium]MBS1726539.1 type IV pilus assembly protein PilM [Armatimonadota bacterium]